MTASFARRIGATNQERAKVAYIRGRALDAFEEYNKDAEAALARAVRDIIGEPPYFFDGACII